MESSPNPYASPQFAGTPVAAKQSLVKPTRPFRSLQGIAMIIVVLLAICGVVDVLAIGSSYMQIQLLQSALGGGFIAPQEAEANDAREAIVALAQLGATLLTAIPYLIWMHRAHGNLPALGATKLQYSPGWAVGGWFVPFLNLVRPYQVTQEIWKYSQPDEPGLEQQPTGSAYVGWWWGLWILSGIGGQISFRVGLNAGDDIEQLMLATWIDLGVGVIGIPLALLAIVVVRGISNNQEQRNQQSEFANADSSTPAFWS